MQVTLIHELVVLVVIGNSVILLMVIMLFALLFVWSRDRGKLVLIGKEI